MQFPHLSDTTFPNVDTVNVYQFENTFDYTRWNEDTRITLCNVLWNSDYIDVVKWDTNELRDAWFDSLTDVWVTKLMTKARMIPDNYMKLPIPYDILARYNYVFIDMPIATSASELLDYENADGIRRWYFFINSIRYLSPSTTEVLLMSDVWVNYQNDIDITYMLLERGHAPVAESDTDEYLSNPIANNKYLLAPDVNFDNAGITRSSKFYPFGNGKKWVCFASTVSEGLLTSLGTVVQSNNYSPSGQPTFSDVPNTRFGHQLQVDNFAFGNGYDYSNANTPAEVGYSDGYIANNLTVYAIEADECYGTGTFFSDLKTTCPQFLTTVKACFVVDERCISFGASHTLAGHTLYRVAGTGHTQNITLQKSDFDIPQEYQRFAKLYTAPYSVLEVTDNDGSTFEIRVEETSTLSIVDVTSVAFPYIDMRVFIDGVGGSGTVVYEWRDLKDNIASLGMRNSDWFKYCFDWKIPTFALYIDGATEYMLRAFNRDVKQGINQAVLDYQNTMRGANTAYENACDTADVAYTNTERSAATTRNNSYRSADTGKVNADNTAGVSRKNAENAADLARTNATNTYGMEKTNSDNTSTTNKTNTDNAADATYNTLDRTTVNQEMTLDFANIQGGVNEMTGIAASDEIVRLNNLQNSLLLYYGNEMIKSTTVLNNETSTATTTTNSQATIISSAWQGAQAGAVFGVTNGSAMGTLLGPGAGTAGGALVGTAIGSVIGAAGGAIVAAANQANIGLTTNTGTQIASLQQEYNKQVVVNGNAFANNVQEQQDSNRNSVYNNNVTHSTSINNANISTSRLNGSDNMVVTKQNALNAQTTARQNSANARDTAATNAQNTHNIAYQNAANSESTRKANSANTKRTSRLNASDNYVATEANADNTCENVKANAGFTRQVEEINAKEILRNKKLAAMASINDSRNATPTERGAYSGNPQPDFMRTRGVQIKVKTQSDSAIRQAGDTFVRFGYALNQIWNVAQSGLKLMQHFTYWKAAEIWIDDSKSSNNAVNNMIHQIFLNGVTVWGDPDKIGKVDVYAN